MIDRLPTEAAQALFRGILASPEDDTQRLMLADELDENAGTVPCAGCDRYARTGRSHCPVCHAPRGDRGWTRDGNELLAKMIREQVAWQRMPDCGHSEPRHGCDRCSRRLNTRGYLTLDVPVGNGHHSAWMAWSSQLPAARAAGWQCLDSYHSDAGNLGPMGLRDYRIARLDACWYGFDRGFVGRLWVPSTTALFGGVCWRCGGEGRVESPNPQFTRTCPVCDHKGEVPPIAEAIWSNYPIREVVVGDMRFLPIRYSSSNGAHVICRAADATCWGIVQPDMRWPATNSLYKTRDEAARNVSATLVHYGRRLAGLPESPSLPALPDGFWPEPIPGLPDDVVVRAETGGWIA